MTHDQDEALSLADRIVVLRDGRMRQIGTPEDLYARPGAPRRRRVHGLPQSDCNLWRNRTDEGVAVRIGGARVIGMALETIGPRAVAAIRPEDLTPAPDGPIAATVEAAEYRGRDFYGFARAADGTELFFRSEARVRPGDASASVRRRHACWSTLLAPIGYDRQWHYSPPPLEGGGWGEGSSQHRRCQSPPLPPTPSLTGRGSI